jgi:hypothetical protein
MLTTEMTIGESPSIRFRESESFIALRQTLEEGNLRILDAVGSNHLLLRDSLEDQTAQLSHVIIEESEKYPANLGSPRRPGRAEEIAKSCGAVRGSYHESY